MDKTAIGIRIKNIRQKKGLNQNEFGKLVLDAHKSLVSKWEKGQSLPNNERLKKIAELGETTVEYLLYGSLDDYARNLLNDLEKELNEDDSISEKVADSIISDIENRLFPKFFPRGYNDRESLEKEFNEYKKSTMELWTNYEKIELEIASRISHQISDDIYSNLEYFYVTTYDKDGEKGKKITTRSDEFVKRLENLDRFQRAYIESFRFLDSKETVEELDKIEKNTDKLNELNGTVFL